TQVAFPGYTDAGLANGTVNYYVVSAINAFGESANSAEVSDTAAALGGAPAHGTLRLNTDGSFTYAPVANFFGTDAFQYQRKDAAGALSNIATVTVTILSVNHVPVAANESYTLDEDTVLTVAAPGVLGNDTDVDVQRGDTLFAFLATGPAHGKVTMNI